MNYSSLLTTEQKKNILEQRIAQFAAEAYQHDLNKKLANGNEEAVAVANNALNTLEAAINLHQDELKKLGE